MRGDSREIVPSNFIIIIKVKVEESCLFINMCTRGLLQHPLFVLLRRLMVRTQPTVVARRDLSLCISRLLAPRLSEGGPVMCQSCATRGVECSLAAVFFFNLFLFSSLPFDLRWCLRRRQQQVHKKRWKTKENR